MRLRVGGLPLLLVRSQSGSQNRRKCRANWPCAGLEAGQPGTFALRLPIATRVQPSGIHGLGFFTVESVPVGTPIWRFLPGFDRDFSLEQFAALPPLARGHQKFEFDFFKLAG